MVESRYNRWIHIYYRIFIRLFYGIIMAKKKQIVDRKIVLAAIAAIVVLESIALLNGINGQLLRGVIGALFLLTGITIPNPLRR